MEEQKKNPAQGLSESEQVQVRRQKLADLQAAGRDPFTLTKFPQDAYSADLKEEFKDLPNETDSGKKVALAGRLMSKRVMGKASFAHLRDDKGDIQLYVRRDELGDDAYAAFKKLDVGDIIGVKGEVFRTKTGELSARAEEITLLAKSLRPLPEKFHGLTDTEMRYRQRYVDLIANPEVKETFVKRSKILKEIRAYLDEKGFLEVDTPILTPFEIGASARPFYTHHNTLNMDMVLRIETELYLKRLIVGGMDRVYEVGRIFRNEGMDPKHNPEFTTIELYQAFTDFHGMMDLVEELIDLLIVLRLGAGLVHGDVLRPNVAALHLPAPHGAAGVHILPAGDSQGLSLLHQPSRHGPRLIQQVHRRADVDGFRGHHFLGIRYQLLTGQIAEAVLPQHQPHQTGMILVLVLHHIGDLRPPYRLGQDGPLAVGDVRRQPLGGHIALRQRQGLFRPPAEIQRRPGCTQQHDAQDDPQGGVGTLLNSFLGSLHGRTSRIHCLHYTGSGGGKLPENAHFRQISYFLKKSPPERGQPGGVRGILYGEFVWKGSGTDEKNIPWLDGTVPAAADGTGRRCRRPGKHQCKLAACRPVAGAADPHHRAPSAVAAAAAGPRCAGAGAVAADLLPVGPPWRLSPWLPGGGACGDAPDGP